ncbi:unnamed protein product [Rotaria sp. Silwood1]|nr:unnamed protein product [Rotaria sp. Silwood1]CAF3388522.1 unnamed protein product [Rotaria sp. Silwood1]CAF3413017.1 unnamed protein product [Rotaria sp. Silwood1]CAF4540661.1 unnamed protein product [Rotaria sp. Silwood1]
MKRETQKGISLYVCTNKSCTRSVTLQNDTIIKCNGITHDHDPKLNDNVEVVLTGIKRRVLADVDVPIGKIYEEEVKRFRRVNGSAATIPVFDAWRSTLYSIRKTTVPSVPTSIDSITIPDIMSFTHSHEQLLFCYTNAPHKIIAFASESALKILSKNHHWNADGTFRTAPSLFSQAYYIHKVKKYGLTKLSKEQNIRRQIANIISLPLVPTNEINNFMERIIDVLSNIDSKFDKLTDYVLNTYVEDGRFSSVLWNHFDSIGERSRTNNHLEGWDRQLNARIRVHPDLWTWFNEIKSSKESVMIRHEQEQAQQRTTRPRKAIDIRDDAKLKAAKLKSLQDQDFESYGKVLRSICHRYIDVLIHSKDSSDEE